MLNKSGESRNPFLAHEDAGRASSLLTFSISVVGIFIDVLYHTEEDPFHSLFYDLFFMRDAEFFQSLFYIY